MKLVGMKENEQDPRKRNYCATQTRNRPKDKPLYLRITHNYHSTTVKVELALNNGEQAADPEGEVPFMTCFDLPISLEEGETG